jgi:hypothetical protein
MFPLPDRNIADLFTAPLPAGFLKVSIPIQ